MSAPTTARQTCDACKGEGKVYVPICIGGSDHGGRNCGGSICGEDEFDCPVCDGAGFTEEEE